MQHTQLRLAYQQPHQSAQLFDRAETVAAQCLEAARRNTCQAQLHDGAADWRLSQTGNVVFAYVCFTPMWLHDQPAVNLDNASDADEPSTLSRTGWACTIALAQRAGENHSAFGIGKGWDTRKIRPTWLEHIEVGTPERRQTPAPS
jgi:hypothetical protein